MSDGEKVDISKIRPGDSVTLTPLEVIEVAPAHVQVKYIGGWIHWVVADQIAAHHPAPREFQVGDRVRLKEGSVAGTVRGVDSDAVWVRWSQPINPPIMPAHYLTLVEAGQ